MTELVLSHSWTRQPQYVAAISDEWLDTKPLGVWIGSTNQQNLAQSSLRGATAVATGVGAPGKHLSFPAASGVSGMPIGSAASVITNKVSVWALVEVSSAAFWPMILSAGIDQSGGAGREGFELRLFSTNGTPDFNVDTGARVDAIGSSIVGVGPVLICGTYDGTTITMYVGNNAPVTAAQSGNIAGIGADWRIGNRSGAVDNTFAFAGKIYAIGVHATCLSPARVKALRDNVWQILAPIERRIWVPGVAAAGGGATYTADATESATAGESASSAAAFAGSTAESATADSAQTAVVVSLAAATESASASDTESAASDANAETTESASAGDTQSWGAVTSASTSDAASASDDQAALATATASASESADATESASAQFSVSASAAETAAASDSHSSTAALAVTASDAADATEVQSTTGASQAAEASESAAAGDAGSAIVQASSGITEAVVAASSQATTANLVASVAEAFVALDAPAAAFVVASVCNESATAGDDSDASRTGAGVSASVSEGVTGADISGANAALAAVSSESVSASETRSAIAQVVASIAEGAIVVDVQTATWVAFAGLSESVSLADLAIMSIGPLMIDYVYARIREQTMHAITRRELSHPIMRRGS